MATREPPSRDDLTGPGWALICEAYRALEVHCRATRGSAPSPAEVAGMYEKLARREDVAATDRLLFERKASDTRDQVNAERACERVPSSLLDRPATAADDEAAREAPRPGIWAGERGADLRTLTQDETDAL